MLKLLVLFLYIFKSKYQIMREISQNYKKAYLNIIVIVAYIFLTLIFTAPVIFQINSHIAGSDDAFQVLKNVRLNSEQYSITNINDIGHFINPLKIGNIYSHLFILDKIFSEPLAYNLYWLLSFILSALGAYYLIYYLIKNRTAAFIAGFLYSFSAIHFTFSLGFGPATHIEWIPLFILFLLKYIEKPSLKNILLIVFFSLFIIENDPHFALYTLLFSFILIVYYLLKKPEVLKNKRFQYYSLGSIVLIVFAFIVFFGPMIKTTLSEDNYLNPGIAQTEWNSADLAGFFTPSSLQVFWGKLSDFINYQFTGNAAERTVYIGFIVLFLTTVAFIYRKGEYGSKFISFWLFNAILFSVLSLGPFLHLLGEINPKIPMPYLFLYRYIPFFQNIRGTGRIFIIASLSFSILGAYGIKILIEKYADKINLRALIIGTVFVLVAIEAFLIIPTSAVAPPEFYKKLATEQGDFKIIQPLITTTYPYATMAFYYNSYHDKKFIGSDFSHFVRSQAGDLKFENETPIITDLLNYLPWGETKMNSRFIKQNFKSIGNYVLSNVNNIKYLILDKNTIKNGGGYFTDQNFAYYKKYLETNLDCSIAWDDKDLLVYKINPTNAQPLTLQRGKNWSQINYDVSDNQEGSWITNETTLLLNNHSNSIINAEITLTMSSPLPDVEKMFEKINVNLNDKLKGSYLIGPTQKEYMLYFDNVLPGENTIKFTVLNGDNNITASNDLENGETIYENTVLVKNISYSQINSIEKPSIYNAIEQEPGDFGIIQIPKHSNYSFDTEFFTDKKIGSKQIAENDYYANKISGAPTLFNFIDYSRLYGLFPLMANHINWDEINTNFNIYNQNYFYSLSLNMQKKYNVRYVVLDKNKLGNDAIENFRTYFKNIVWDSRVSFENNDYLVYRLEPFDFNPNLLEVNLGENWGPLLWGQNNQPPECRTQCRNIYNDSALNIFNYSSQIRPGKLKFNITGNEDTPIYLHPILNEKAADKILINEQDQSIIINLDEIKPGYNNLKFYFEDFNGALIEDVLSIKIYNLSI